MKLAAFETEVLNVCEKYGYLPSLASVAALQVEPDCSGRCQLLVEEERKIIERLRAGAPGFESHAWCARSTTRAAVMMAVKRLLWPDLDSAFSIDALIEALQERLS